MHLKVKLVLFEGFEALLNSVETFVKDGFARCDENPHMRLALSTELAAGGESNFGVLAEMLLELDAGLFDGELRKHKVGALEFRYLTPHISESTCCDCPHFLEMSHHVPLPVVVVIIAHLRYSGESNVVSPSEDAFRDLV